MIEKIIRLHLNGDSVRDIENKTGVDKSTVQNIIELWRHGEYDVYKEAITAEDEAIEFIKYLKSSGTELSELKDAYINNKILRERDMSFASLLTLAEIFKNSPEKGPKYLENAVVLFEDLENQKMPFENLVEQANNLKSTIKELDDKLSKLEEKQENADKTYITKQSKLDDLQKSIRELAKEADEKTGDIAKKVDELQNLNDDLIKKRNEINKNATAINTAKKLTNFMNKNNIDMAKLLEFSKVAKVCNYDPKNFDSLVKQADFLNNENLTIEDMVNEVVRSSHLDEKLKILEEQGLTKENIELFYEKAIEKGIAFGDALNSINQYYEDSDQLQADLKDLKFKKEQEEAEYSEKKKQYQTKLQNLEIEYAEKNQNLKNDYEKSKANDEKAISDREIEIKKLELKKHNKLSEIQAIISGIKDIEDIKVQIKTEKDNVETVRNEREKIEKEAQTKKGELEFSKELTDLLLYDNTENFKDLVTKLSQIVNQEIMVSPADKKMFIDALQVRALKVLLHLTRDKVIGVKSWEVIAGVGANTIKFIDKADYELHNQKIEECIKKEAELDRYKDMLSNKVNEMLSGKIEAPAFIMELINKQIKTKIDIQYQIFLASKTTGTVGYSVTNAVANILYGKNLPKKDKFIYFYSELENHLLKFMQLDIPYSEVAKAIDECRNVKITNNNKEIELKLCEVLKALVMQ